MQAYEIKWGKGRGKQNKDFLKAYDKSTIQLVNKDSFWDFAEGKNV